MVWGLASGMALDKPRAIISAPHGAPATMQLPADGRLMARPTSPSSVPGVEVFEMTEGRPLGPLNFEAGERFHALAFDPGGQRLAVSLIRQDGTRSIRTWDVAARPRERHSWVIGQAGHPLEFSPDGRFLAVYRGDGITLHDPWTGKVHVVLAGSRAGPVRYSSFSDDGRFLAVHGAGDRVFVWETNFGREVARFESVGRPVRLAFSPRGSRVAAMDESGRVVVCERATGQMRVLTQGVGDRNLFLSHSLAFSPDEALLAIEIDSGRGRPIEVWEVETAHRLDFTPGGNIARGLSFVRGGRSLIVHGGSTPRIWRLEPPPEPDALAGHNTEAWAAAFSPDGKVLATGGDDTNEPQTIKLWDPVTGRLLAGWQAHTATVATLAFSPDGRLIASGSLDSGKPGHPNVILWAAVSHKTDRELGGAYRLGSFRRLQPGRPLAGVRQR